MSKALILIVISTFIFSQNLQAQQKQKAAKKSEPPPATVSVSSDGDHVGSSGPVLKFDAADAPANKESRPAMKFTEPTVSAGAPSVAPIATNDTPADEQGFKTYIGYPKHELILLTQADSISATFSYLGQDFNFSTQALVYGLAYNLVATPSWKVGVMYQQYNVGVGAGRASGLDILDSDETLSQFGINAEYCSISASNFYRQFCFGGLIMKDAYPFLDFVGGSTLAMSKLEDIVVGLNTSMQWRLTDSVLIKPILGFNYGTTSGDSGTLTPKSNLKMYLRTEVPWAVTSLYTLRFHGDFSLRRAEAEGLNGVNQDVWETNSANLGLGLDFIAHF